MVSTLGCHIF